MPLCVRCRRGLIPASDPRDRFFAPDPGVVVGDAFDLAVASFRYEGVARRVVTRLKYGGASRLARPLAETAAPQLSSLASITGPAVLVPVPIHPARRHERGYNQAALVASALGRELAMPVRDLLVRHRETTKQHRLNRAARLRNLRAAFRVGEHQRAPPTVILVDDILTTSATLEACASVLGEAGARRVYGFALCREV